MNQKLELPYDEGLARDIIAALQGHLYNTNFDAKTVPLEKVLSPLNAHFGVRMYSITQGPGKHSAEISYGNGRRATEKEYEVPEGQVYATIDTIGFMSGTCETYMFTKEENKLKLQQEDIHMTS